MQVRAFQSHVKNVENHNSGDTIIQGLFFILEAQLDYFYSFLFLCGKEKVR